MLTCAHPPTRPPTRGWLAPPLFAQPDSHTHTRADARLDVPQGKFIMGLTYSPDGRLLASGASDGIIALFDTARLRLQDRNGAGCSGRSALAHGPVGARTCTHVLSLVNITPARQVQERARAVDPHHHHHHSYLMLDAARWSRRL